jgi:Domain of unknown function (DUF4388)
MGAVPGWLEISDDGCPELDGESAEQLAGRRYALLEAPAELLVGVAWEHAGSEGRVVLAGDLSRISFPEVVSLVAQARATGVLRVAGESALRTVVFWEGEVRGASSDRVGERLGEVAVRMGLLKRRQMEALREDARSGRRAGRIAVERGLLSERDLWNAIQEHVITIFQAILLESRGSFAVSEEVLEEELTVPGLGAAALLMECARRIDELRGIASGAGARRTPEAVATAFNGAFRDIFSTAEDAGAGDALRAAAVSMFEDDPAHARLLRGLAFTPQGELPEAALVERAAAEAQPGGASASELLSDALSTLMLFLLFVAGEHLEPSVHRGLHARVKLLAARD